MMGLSISGIIINIIRAISLSVLSDMYFESSLLFFTISAILLGLASVSLWKFFQLEFVKYHFMKVKRAPKHEIVQSSINNDDYIKEEVSKKRQRITLSDYLNNLKIGFASQYSYLLAMTCLFSFTFSVFPAIMSQVHFSFLEFIDNQNS